MTQIIFPMFEKWPISGAWSVSPDLRGALAKDNKGCVSMRSVNVAFSIARIMSSYEALTSSDALISRSDNRLDSFIRLLLNSPLESH